MLSPIEKFKNKGLLQNTAIRHCGLDPQSLSKESS